MQAVRRTGSAPANQGRPSTVGHHRMVQAPKGSACSAQTPGAAPGPACSTSRPSIACAGTLPSAVAQLTKPFALLGVETCPGDECPWDIGTTTEQGLRDYQEDAVKVHFDEDTGVLFAGVYDGHGGPEAAQWLGQQLHDKLLKALKANPPSNQEELSSTMTAAFESADEELMEELKRQGMEVLEEAGATATVVMAGAGGQLMVANVGDSQCFLMRDKVAKDLTTPHRVYGFGADIRKEMLRVTKTGAWIFDGRVCNCLAVSRAFGDWELKPEGLPTLLPRGVERGWWSQRFADNKADVLVEAPVVVEPSVRATILTPSDELLVLATDGLWDVMPGKDALHLARSKLRLGSSAQDVAEALAAAALQRKSTDNISVTVVNFKDASYWAEEGAPPSAWLGKKMQGMFGGLSNN